MIPEFDCLDPADPCCDCLYAITRALVNAAADAVEECLPVGLCDDLARHVSIGRPVGPGDYVGGWIESIQPAPSRQNTAGAKQLLGPRLVGNIGVRLVETGFPTIQAVGGRVSMPDFAKLDYISSHFYGHAEMATRALLNEMTPACSRGCDSLRFLSSRPSQPETTSMAWDWAFEATLKW